MEFAVTHTKIDTTPSTNTCEIKDVYPTAWTPACNPSVIFLHFRRGIVRIFILWLDYFLSSKLSWVRYAGWIRLARPSFTLSSFRFRQCLLLAIGTSLSHHRYVSFFYTNTLTFCRLFTFCLPCKRGFLYFIFTSKCLCATVVSSSPISIPLSPVSRKY